MDLSQESAELVDSSIGLLATTPADFEAALSKLGIDTFARRPHPDEWPPVELLIHIRAADLIQLSRIWSTLIRGTALHPGFDERAYGDLLERAGLSAEDQLAAFVLRRRELIHLLHTLSDNEWSTTIHTDLGQVVVSELIVEMASHEGAHVEQPRRTVVVLGLT